MLNKPKYIKNAAFLIVLTLFVGILKIPLDYDFISSVGPIQSTIIITAAIVFMMLLLAYKIWQGRNWARITFTVYFVIGILPGVLQLPAQAERSVLLASFSALQLILQIAVLVLMYLPASNGWFKSTKAASNA